MALIARAEPGADLYTEGTHFQFDKQTGKRNVTRAEADILERYQTNGGVLKIEITETKGKKEGDA